jgi:predicted HTH transcriptional regulator
VNAGKVLGLMLSKDTLESLANRIQQQTDRKVCPALMTADVEHKTVVVVRVDESPLKPVLVQGRGFKRVERSNHVL